MSAKYVGPLSFLKSRIEKDMKKAREELRGDFQWYDGNGSVILRENSESGNIFTYSARVLTEPTTGTWKAPRVIDESKLKLELLSRIFGNMEIDNIEFFSEELRAIYSIMVRPYVGHKKFKKEWIA
jgi:hypothetical protein